jgi:hypothetical protein
MEKKENRRHNSDTAVRCSFLTTLRCGALVNGIMKNYSCGGMYAELRARFKAGTILVVRPTRSPSGCPDKAGYRSMSLVEANRKASSLDSAKCSDMPTPCTATPSTRTGRWPIEAAYSR